LDDKKLNSERKPLTNVNTGEDVASSDEEDKEEHDCTPSAAAPVTTETMGGRPLAESTATDPASMKKKIVTRTVIALMMIAFYMIMITAGHLYCILVAMAVQIELFRELVNARYVGAKGKEMPLFRTLQWSWFVLAMFYSCE
jgi:phosphatidate cytidylyltransferase